MKTRQNQREQPEKKSRKRKSSPEKKAEEPEVEYALWIKKRCWSFFDDDSKIWVATADDPDAVYVYYKANVDGPLEEDRYHCLSCYHWSYVSHYVEGDINTLFEHNNHLSSCKVSKERVKMEKMVLDKLPEYDGPRKESVEVITIDDTDDESTDVTIINSDESS